LDPTRTVVRINARDSEHFDEDLKMLAQTDYTAVMLPKSEHGEDLTVLADYQVIALIETALGAVTVSDIAACPTTYGLISYSEDLRRLAQTDYSAVLLPKSAHLEDLTVLADYQVIALIETALGAVNVSEIAVCPNTSGLMWGSEDLIADLGGGSSRTADGDY